MAIGFVDFAIDSPPPTAGAIFVFALAATGGLLLVAGAAGALGEMVFGFHWFSRTLFTAALIALLASFALGEGSTLKDAAAFGGGIVTLLGGAVMFILRVRALRAALRLVDVVTRDVADGRVLRFAGQVPEGDMDDHGAAISSGQPQFPAMARHSLDLLPGSSVVVRIDDALRTLITTLPVHVAATAGSSIEVRLPPPHSGTSASRDLEVFQRHLRPAERSELEQLVARALRLALVSSVFPLWAIGAFWSGHAGRLETFGGRALQVAITAAALALAMWPLVQQLNRVRLLRRDLREGKVLVARRSRSARLAPSDHASDFSLQESLNCSREPWTVFGQPAPWRLHTH